VKSLFSFLILFSTLVHASPEGAVKAQRLFQRLTGTPLSVNDPRFNQMVAFIDNGEEDKAAAIATEDTYFYQVTVKNASAIMSNRSETPFTDLSDFQATFIGAVRDDLDARTLLTGNYLYKAKPDLVEDAPSRGSNKHYEEIDEAGLDYKTSLVKQEPQWEGFKNHAGLLTTRGWAAAHYDAGTNRRAVVYAYQEFLCVTIDNWKVAGLPDDWVGRDIDRTPGKDPKVYQEQCRTCHAGMDSQRGAFAYMDFINGSLVELPDGRPAPKYSRGATTYPTGHITDSDKWVNLISAFQPTIGFKEGQTEGKGINSFAESLANTEAFKECMTSRVFTAVCQRPPQPQDKAVLQVVAKDFAKNGYNLKKLFQQVAILPACLGE
jgi:hypothetical protein